MSVCVCVCINIYIYITYDVHLEFHFSELANIFFLVSNAVKHLFLSRDI